MKKQQKPIADGTKDTYHKFSVYFLPLITSLLKSSFANQLQMVFSITILSKRSQIIQIWFSPQSWFVYANM